MKYSVASVAALEPIAKELVKSSIERPIILFDAEMGRGKTTLIKAILAELGHHDTSSPTFSIVNRYDTDQGAWYHFDLYRIEVSTELDDMGFAEYLDSGRPCLIEWPSLAKPFIDGPYTSVNIVLEGESRLVTIVHH